MTAASLLRVEVEAVDGGARATVLHTPRGRILTPCFMPVGTRGAVRALGTDDLELLGAQVVLGNTYHLMLRPGAGVVAELGGLHEMMDWSGHLLTDSGGYQVFSLEPVVDDDGAVFRSTYDGSTHRLTPESAVTVQQQLGADIQMVLDVCPPLPSSDAVVRAAVDRTAAWAARAKAAMAPARAEGATQALFGIVQGGVDPSLRRAAAERTLEIGFDGYGIGGLSVGESRDEMLPALAAVTAVLPTTKVRYLMGVGDPIGMLEAVALGVDLFDCVLPTRLARHGTILTDDGRMNLRNARFVRDLAPLDPTCGCPVCARWSRGYLRHLLAVGEPSVLRYLTMHNVWWLLRLVESARAAIVAGEFGALLTRTRERWA